MGVPESLKDTKSFQMVTGFDTDGNAQAPLFEATTDGLIVSDIGKFYWKDKRYDWTSGDIDYLGFSTSINAATDTGDLWWVWKFAWSAGDLTRVQGPVNCNWDDRAASF